ncbi:hypothetical protein ACFPPD_20815 [Cohnella suwonensis]|uniref:Uncharacterized protein n=1 Tax=Cohnella suwonensis TaxID=696072 RepID=A0ABW0LZ40_9BACL
MRILTWSFLLATTLLAACTTKSGHIDTNQAIEIAKKLETNEDVVWQASLEKNKEVVIGNAAEKHDVWIVTAEYPMHNKMIVQIEADTGEVISVIEVEADDVSADAPTQLPEPSFSPEVALSPVFDESKPTTASEPESSPAPIVLKENELRSLFEETWPVVLPDGQTYRGFIPIDENKIVYSTEETNGLTSSFYELDFLTGLATKIGTVDGSVYLLKYNDSNHQLQIKIAKENQESYAAWVPGSAKIDSNPRILLTRNDNWSLFKTNENEGIWAIRNEGGKPIRLTEYDLDHDPIWIPGTNQFVYVAYSGHTIADGSGYGFSLSRYDLDKMAGEPLPFGEGPLILKGWLNIGKALLVDRAFNEGQSVDYTEPAVIRLTGNKETKLIADNMKGFNLAYNETSSEFALSIPGYFGFYDSNGEIVSLTPWFTDSSESATSPFMFSPDGSKGDYLMGGTYGSRLVISDSRGNRAKRLNEEPLPIDSWTWTPKGSAIIAFVGNQSGSYFVLQKAQSYPHDR